MLVGCDENRNIPVSLPAYELSRVERTYEWVYGYKADKFGFPPSLKLKLYNGSSWTLWGGVVRVKYTNDSGKVVERKYRFTIYNNKSKRIDYLYPLDHGTGNVQLIWFDNDEIGSTSMNIVDFSKKTDVFVEFFGKP